MKSRGGERLGSAASFGARIEGRRRQVGLALFVLVLVFTGCPTPTFGYNQPTNRFKTLLSEFFPSSRVADESATRSARPVLLEGHSAGLNLTASTKPARFRVSSAAQVPNLVLASLPAVLRAGSGSFSQNYKASLVPRQLTKYTLVAFQGRQLEEAGVYRVPCEPVVLYDDESCPYCRLVREACSMLSLSVTFRPVPRGGRRHPAEMTSRFGKGVSPPVLIDPNTSVTLFGSADIVPYLFKVYGDAQVPWTLRNTAAAFASSALGLLLFRLGAGGTYSNSRSPPDNVPLVLWAYEGSPFCKVVRETLSELELPHTIVFAPRGSANRQKMFDVKGLFQVPYLEDPTTGVSLYESEAINEYLVKQYAVERSPVDFI